MSEVRTPLNAPVQQLLSDVESLLLPLSHSTLVYIYIYIMFLLTFFFFKFISFPIFFSICNINHHVQMDAVYTGLSEKFGVHNQEELADALQDAKERLLRCQPPTTAEVRIEKKKKRKRL